MLLLGPKFRNLQIMWSDACLGTVHSA